jgi:hypothetical protein
MLEFHPLTFADQPPVDSALERFPPEVSELTFTNLWCYGRKRRVEVAHEPPGGGTPQRLTLLCEEGERRFFLPPTCLCDAVGVVRDLFDFALASGFAPEVERVPEEMAAELGAAGLSVAEDRPNWDYVYTVEDLAFLEGRHYDGKRNFVKQALRFGPEYRRIGPENVADCLALSASWCNLRECDADPGLAAEQHAIRLCLENWERLPLVGGAVYVEGRVEAFAFGEKLNPTTAVVHFEKANPELRGMYQLVNQWFCRNELLAYRFVNREQDLGIEGLRRAKESYRPHHLVKKYRVGAGGAG